MRFVYDLRWLRGPSAPSPLRPYARAYTCRGLPATCFALPWRAALALSLLLVSTISAMVLAGPRVLRTMGEDIPALRGLSACNLHGAPTRAILLQQGLALVFVLTNSFEGVLTFAGFTLALFSCLTVAGVFRLRTREPALARPFRMPLYPLPPLLFLLVNGLALLAVIWERPQTALAVLALLVLGGLLLKPNDKV